MLQKKVLNRKRWVTRDELTRVEFEMPLDRVAQAACPKLPDASTETLAHGSWPGATSTEGGMSATSVGPSSKRSLNF